MNSGDVPPEVNRYFRAEKRRRGPREQCRSHSQCLAVSGPVLGGHGAQPVATWANRGVPRRARIRGNTKQFGVRRECESTGLWCRPARSRAPNPGRRGGVRSATAGSDECLQVGGESAYTKAGAHMTEQLRAADVARELSPARGAGPVALRRALCPVHLRGGPRRSRGRRDSDRPEGPTERHDANGDSRALRTAQGKRRDWASAGGTARIRAGPDGTGEGRWSPRGAVVRMSRRVRHKRQKVGRRGTYGA